MQLWLDCITQFPKPSITSFIYTPKLSTPIDELPSDLVRFFHSSVGTPLKLNDSVIHYLPIQYAWEFYPRVSV